LTRAIAGTLAALLFVLAHTPAFAASPSAETHTTPAQVAMAFLDAVVKGEYSAAVKLFDDTMQMALPAEKLEATWKGVLLKTGAFEKNLGTRDEPAGKYTVVLIGVRFEKVPMDVKVVIDGGGRIAGFSCVPPRPSEPLKPAPYVVAGSFSQVEVKVGQPPWELPGTLTMPKAHYERALPAVVFVHGSGPSDRDETVGPNKPFRDLSWGLASQGIAGLRYEKRTKEHSAKLVADRRSFTLREETIDDATAAIELLRKTKGIDRNRIFVLGHSFGGYAVPRILEQNQPIAGGILLASNTRPLEDLILEQMTYVYSLDAVSPDHHQGDLEQLKRQVARIKNLKPSAGAESPELFLGLAAPYWLYLRQYDATATAARLRNPLLILQGERDYQITANDFERWKQALATRKNVVFRRYPRLNHLFMPGSGKPTPAEYETPGHVDPAVVNDIVTWIESVSGRAGKTLEIRTGN
jgi:fermentation-respiration switch protein FrsA (DUF1100 family)